MVVSWAIWCGDGIGEMLTVRGCCWGEGIDLSLKAGNLKMTPGSRDRFLEEGDFLGTPFLFDFLVE